jgi:hypothetical protein
MMVDEEGAAGQEGWVRVVPSMCSDLRRTAKGRSSGVRSMVVREGGNVELRRRHGRLGEQQRFARRKEEQWVRRSWGASGLRGELSRRKEGRSGGGEEGARQSGSEGERSGVWDWEGRMRWEIERWGDTVVQERQEDFRHYGHDEGDRWSPFLLHQLPHFWDPLLHLLLFHPLSPHRQRP